MEQSRTVCNSFSIESGEECLGRFSAVAQSTEHTAAHTLHSVTKKPNPIT